jgi:hypothetical protein
MKLVRGDVFNKHLRVASEKNALRNENELENPNALFIRAILYGLILYYGK